MKLHPLFTACAALLALSPGLATAQTTAVPNFISYQGRVVDAAGANVGTGTPVNRTVIFRIWDSPSSTNTANLIYSEAQTVTVSEGEFSVLVGQGVANPTATFGYSEADRKLADLGTAFNGSARYLGVTVAAAATIALTDNEITPRQQIVSTAFAMRAKFAESIGSSSDLALTPLSGTASNYGLGWYGTGRLFGGTAVDGPVLYGNAGGALGSNASGTRNTALRWDANGRVGIGATSISSATNKLTLQGDMATTPADQLTIRGNADNNKRLLLGYDTTANKASLQSYTALSTAGPLLLNPSGGLIGIGTSAPSARLSVEGSISATGAGGYIFGTGGDVDGGLFSPADGVVTLNTNGAERLRADASGNVIVGGNVGIGTTSPGNRLSVSDGADDPAKYGSVQITRPATGHTGSHMSFVRHGNHAIGMGYGQSSSLFGFGVGTQTAFSPSWLAIDTSGNVGIGNTSPLGKLTVNSGNSAITIGSADPAAGAWLRNDGQSTVFSSHVGDMWFGWGGIAKNLHFLGGGTTDDMVVLASGNVQIGTTTSDARLNVGAINALVYQNGYLDTNGGQSGDSTTTRALSIRADGLITAPLVSVNSDLRIKSDLYPTDSVKDLKTLMGIQITDYHFKDTIGQGKAQQKKVIAQQVETVYPQAVMLNKGVVPDIYKNAPVKDGWVELATDLKVGDRVRLIGRSEQTMHEVVEVRNGAFRPDGKMDGDSLFVYGREVNDFRSVDYDAISMLNVSATQQLKLEKDAEIQALRDENAALRGELAAKDASHEARLIALERRISKDGATETVSLSTAKVAE